MNSSSEARRYEAAVGREEHKQRRISLRICSRELCGSHCIMRKRASPGIRGRKMTAESSGKASAARFREQEFARRFRYDFTNDSQYDPRSLGCLSLRLPVFLQRFRNSVFARCRRRSETRDSLARSLAGRASHALLAARERLSGGCPRE